MLTKQPLIKEPKKVEPKLNNEQARDVALKIIGHHFTEAFVADHENPSVQKFSTSAEYCRSTIERYHDTGMKTCTGLIAGAGLLAIGLFAADSATFLMFACCLIGAMTFFFSMLYGHGNLAHDKPSGSDRMVAKAWEPWRLVAFQNEIVENLGNQIRYSTNEEVQRNVEHFHFSHASLEAALKGVLERKLVDIGASFRESERDQNPSEAKKFRKAFALVDKLSQALGFSGADWEQLNRP